MPWRGTIPDVFSHSWKKPFLPSLLQPQGFGREKTSSARLGAEPQIWDAGGWGWGLEIGRGALLSGKWGYS